MAQTRKRRRRKRKGTQGGSIDTRRRASRPRSREEAKARARAKNKDKTGPRTDLPPTWKGSAIRGIFAAIIFAVLLIALFKRPIGVALAFGAFMLVFYIPTGYYIDMTLWRRRERARMRSRGE